MSFANPSASVPPPPARESTAADGPQLEAKLHEQSQILKAFQ